MHTSRPKAGGVLARFRYLALLLFALGLSTSAQLAHAQTPYVVLTASSPANGASGVSLTAPIVLTFDREINLAALNAKQQSEVASDRWVQITPSISGGQEIRLVPTVTTGWSRTVTLQHAVPFTSSTLYHVEAMTEIMRADSGNQYAANDAPAEAGGRAARNNSNGAAPVANPFSFTTEDTTAPFIVSHTPADGAIDVATNTSISIVFNKPVDPSTLQVFLDRSVARDSSGNVTTWGDTVQLGNPSTDNPNSPRIFTFSNLNLQGSKSTDPRVPSLRTSYRVRVQVADFGGRALRDNPFGVDNNNRNPWAFTTVDNVRPNATLIQPLNNPDAPVVAPDAPIVITFDEPMRPANIIAPATGQGNATPGRLFNVLVNGNDPGIGFTVESSDNDTRFTFRHTVQFPSEAQVQVAIRESGDGDRSQARDTAGNFLQNTPASTFRIINAQPPTVASTIPIDDPNWPISSNGQTPVRPVPVNTSFTLRFDKPMDRTSLTTANVTLHRFDANGVKVGDPVALNGPTWNATSTEATFTPVNQLLGGPTRYKLQLGNPSFIDLNTGAITNPDAFRASLPRDAQGNRLTGSAALGSDYAISFITEDRVPPLILSHSPINGESDVPLDHAIVIRFGTPVNFDPNNEDDPRAPIIELRYAAQELEPPRFGPSNRSGKEIGLGVLRASRLATGSITVGGTSVSPGWNASRNVLTIVPDELSTGVRFREGQAISIRVTNAQDLAGNGAGITTPVNPPAGQATVIANPFQYDMVDLRTPVVERTIAGTLSTEPGDVGLRAPIFVSFNKPIALGSVFFSVPAALDPLGWVNAAAVGSTVGGQVVQGPTIPGRNVYRVEPGAFTNQRRNIILNHTGPFREDTEYTGANAIEIVNVAGFAPTDSRGVPIHPQGVGNDLRAEFRTRHRPIVTAIEYETATHGLTVNDDGMLSGHHPVTATETDRWAPLQGPGGLTEAFKQGEVPRNANIRVTFSGGPMDVSSVPMPSFLLSPTGEDLRWRVQWANNNTVAIFSHDVPFTGHSRGGTAGRAVENDGTVLPGSIPYQGLVIAAGRSLLGDELRVGSARLTTDFANPVVKGPGDDDQAGANSGMLYISPYDTVAPSFVGTSGSDAAIEYLTNPGEADASKHVWAPLAGANGIPVNTRIRVTANEALSESVGVKIEKTGDGPDFAVLDASNRLEVQNANGFRRNRWVWQLGTSGTYPRDFFADEFATATYGVTDGRVVQVPKTYKLKVTITDRSTRPKTNTRDNINFTPRDLLPPVLSRIIVGPSQSLHNLGANPNRYVMQATDAITLEFSEEVKAASVTLKGDLPDDDMDTTFTRVTTGNARQIVFTHPELPTNPDKPLTLRVRVEGVDFDDDDAIAGVEDVNGNEQTSLARLNDVDTDVNARTSDFIIFEVRQDVTPPVLLSAQLGRDILIAQFNESMRSVTNNDTGVFTNSVFDPNNYAITHGWLPPGANATRVVEGTANRLGEEALAGGLASLEIAQNGIQYDDTTKSVRIVLTRALTTPPAGSTNETIRVKFDGGADGLTDRLGNPLADTVRTFDPPLVGRANWRIELAAESDVPGAPEGVLTVGVSQSATNGYNEGVDIPKPPIFGGVTGFVEIYSDRTGDPDFGAEGRPYVQDLVGLPAGNVSSVIWQNVTVNIVGLGRDLLPPTITITPNLLLDGAELPPFFVAELQELDTTIDASPTGEPDGVRSYDLSQLTGGLKFPALADPDTGNLVKRFRLLVHMPKLDELQLTPGFNLISMPLDPVNPAVQAALGAVNPLLVWRYNTAIGRYEIYPQTGSPFSAVETGRAYWVRPRAAQTIQVFGTPNVGAQVISLQTGWNAIGNPFSTDLPSANFRVLLKDGTIVPLATVLADVDTYGLDSSFVRFEGEQPVDVVLGQGTLPKGRGAWVFLFEGTQVAGLVVSPPVTQ